MFTGIVEETGELLARERTEEGIRLRIAADDVATGLEHGQSVSVNGACLTVERFEPGAWFEVFLAAETVDRTYLADLAVGDAVNLERAMPADGRFDGHVVQGHVDAVATVTDVRSIGDGEARRASDDGEARRASDDSEARRASDAPSGDEPEGDWEFDFELPEGYDRYVVEKGSITLDGISLTVAARSGRTVTVAVVPTTYAVTTLSEKAVGDPVHLEVDVLAKYVERLLESDRRLA